MRGFHGEDTDHLVGRRVDESDVADLIREALEAGGFACVLAANADEADEALASRRFDAVTLDVCMPGRSGIEWLRSIADDHPELAARTVVVTGTTLTREDRDTIDRCRASLLHKPFSLAKLLRLVRHCESPTV